MQEGEKMKQQHSVKNKYKNIRKITTNRWNAADEPKGQWNGSWRNREKRKRREQHVLIAEHSGKCK